MEYVYLSVFCVVAVLVAYKAGYSKARGDISVFDGKIESLAGVCRENLKEIGNIYQALQVQDVEQQKEAMRGLDEMEKMLKGMVGNVPDHVDAPLVPKTGHSLGSRTRKG